MPTHLAEATSHSVVTVLNENSGTPIVIVCEHAARHIPPEYDNLGVDAAASISHAAWDIGAAVLATELAQLFDACCVMGNISRLVYDCNRPPEAPDAMPTRSEIFQVPGNQNLTAEDRAARVDRIYRPFERQLSAVMARWGAEAVLVTVHSFTPVYHGKHRPVEIGVLHDADHRLADAILDHAARHTGLLVCRNEPYGPDDGVTHTLKRHGLANGALNVMLEVRNDLLGSEAACRDMAGILYRIIGDARQSLEGPQPSPPPS